MTENQLPRRRRTHERLPKTVRIITYIYPTRNPIYLDLLQRFPPAGSQAVIRTFLVTGWKQAHEEITAWLSACVTDPRTPLPVPDLTRDALPRVRIGLYMKLSNADQARVIDAWQTLPASVRQLVSRLALIRGLTAPEIEERIRTIR
jgi:hypothetical protein